MASRIFRYYHTLVHLKPKQVYHQILHTLRIPQKRLKKIAEPSSFQLLQAKNELIPTIERDQTLVAQNIFKIFDHEAEIKNPEDWQKEHLEPLYRYNLHYFDDLLSKSGDKRSKWHLDLLRRWVNENPVGSIGWDPYPICRRLLNTVKWVHSGNSLPDFWGRSLLHQASVLEKSVEWRLMANHLWENGLALIAAGLFFAGPEADRFYRKGYAVLDKELDEQVGNDGGHFERSPMYHSILLEGLLDLKNIYRVYDREFPKKWDNIILRMIGWLKTVIHPDGEIPYFNDTTSGVAATSGEILEYANRLGIGSDVIDEPISDLIDSGFCVVKKSNYYFIVDVGTIGPSYQPGHAHSQELSFELSIDGVRVFCNPGISTYKAGQTRIQERSAAAHNCLVLDNKNPSQVWSAHRVAKRAIVKHRLEKSDDRITVVASHNGYFPSIYTRTFKLEDQKIIIEDNIESKINPKAIAFYYLHPDISLKKIDPYHYEIKTLNGKLLGEFFVADHNKAVIENSYYHLSYNKNRENVRICVSALDSSSLSLRAEIRISGNK